MHPSADSFADFPDSLQLVQSEPQRVPGSSVSAREPDMISFDSAIAHRNRVCDQSGPQTVSSQASIDRLGYSPEYECRPLKYMLTTVKLKITVAMPMRLSTATFVGPQPRVARACRYAA